MPKPIHHVFNVAYNGIARELRSEAVIRDPLSGKEIHLKRVIWDTGATNSAINENVARTLGLIATGQVQLHTVNGTRIANTYLVTLDLPLSRVRIPELNVSEGDLGDDEMLIGMDVIGLGDFTVQNYAGQTHFSFCLPPFENKYDMVEKANQVNPKNAKHNMRGR